MTGFEAVIEDFKSELQQLVENNKPRINLLTMLAEENVDHAAGIVEAIQGHLQQAAPATKLYSLYLVDSIVKNCRDAPAYKELFAKIIAKLFADVFKTVDERTRQLMFKLRQTWPNFFPSSRLYLLDMMVHDIDPAWPLLNPNATPPASQSQGAAPSSPTQATIHVNPKFLNQQASGGDKPKTEGSTAERSTSNHTKGPAPNPPAVVKGSADSVTKSTASDPAVAQRREQELWKLQQRRLELQILQRQQEMLHKQKLLEKKEQQLKEREEKLNLKPSSSESRREATYESRRDHKTSDPRRDQKATSDPRRERSGSHSAPVVQSVVVPATRPQPLPTHHESTRSMETRNSKRIQDNAKARQQQFVPLQARRRSKEPGCRPSPANQRPVPSRRDDHSKRPISIVQQLGLEQSDDEDSAGEVPAPRTRRISTTRDRQSREPMPAKRLSSDSTDLKCNSGGASPAAGASTKGDVDLRLPPKKRRWGNGDDSIRTASTGSESEGQDAAPKAKTRSPESEMETELFMTGKDEDYRLLHKSGVVVIEEEGDVPSPLMGSDRDTVTPDDVEFIEAKKTGQDRDFAAQRGRFYKDRATPYRRGSSGYRGGPRGGSANGRDSGQFERERDVRWSRYKQDRWSRNDFFPLGPGPVSGTSGPPAMGPDNVPESIVQQRERMINMATHRLSQGEMSKDEYDSLMTDLHRIEPSPGLVGPGSGPQFFGPQSGTPASQMHFYEQANPWRPTGHEFMQEFNLDTPKGKEGGEKKEKDGQESSEPRPEKAPSAIPPNKTIYVEGRAYEVQYLGEVPVIERNNLPHRIFFVGPPRDVVIDGEPHLLAFGEQKTVTIDGQQHVMMFGGPAKELFLGKYPLRGSFGGPPIYLRINGHQHKIQLCGPPPEVKIDPEPDYELSRFLHRKQNPGAYVGPAPIRAGPGPYPVSGGPGRMMGPGPIRGPIPPYGGPGPGFPPRPYGGSSGFPGGPPVGGPVSQNAPPGKPLDSSDVNELLQKLIRNGLIQHPGKSPRPESPPRPSLVMVIDDLPERKSKAPKALKDVNIKDLKIRYETVVQSLYPSGQVCGMCGQRFGDNESDKYSRHLDWHFEKTRREKENRRFQSRQWYFVSDDWVNFDEMGEEAAAKAKSAVFESQIDTQQQNKLEERLPVGTDSVIEAREENSVCEVCGEKFEQFWDEEDELWKLKNAMEKDGKTYHPLCYQDVSVSAEAVAQEASGAAVAAEKAKDNSSLAPKADVAVLQSVLSVVPMPREVLAHVASTAEIKAGAVAAPVRAILEPAKIKEESSAPGNAEVGGDRTPLRDEED